LIPYTDVLWICYKNEEKVLNIFGGIKKTPVTIIHWGFPLD
jgi:hypothetical protein